MVMRVVLIYSQCTEVIWPQQLVAGIDERSEKHLALKKDAVIGVGEPFQPIALVVPIVDGENTGAVPDKMFAFRTKPVHRKLAETANVRAAKKSGFRLKSFGRVLIHRVVFDLARAVFEPVMEGGPAL